MTEKAETQVNPIEEMEKDGTLEGGSKEAIEAQNVEEVRFRISLTNTVNPKITLVKIGVYFWNGWSTSDYPNRVLAWHGLDVWHIGRDYYAGGLKFGFAYKEDTGDDTSGRIYIAAFDGINKKAYAETGPNGPVNWNEIEKKLDLSGMHSEYIDDELGGKAIAFIYPDQQEYGEAQFN